MANPRVYMVIAAWRDKHAAPRGRRICGGMLSIAQVALPMPKG